MLLHQHPSFRRSPAPCATPPAEPVNWDDLRFFLQVLRSRSLTTAARQLGVTQSTVGRRLATLEARLGARLLRRTREGYVCTPAGEAIRERVERIDSETQSIERMIGGLDRRVSGTVRVAAPVLLATHQPSPLTATLRTHYPDLTLELACCSQPLDAPLSGADIAVQLRPFACPDLVVRRVGRLSLGLYASGAALVIAPSGVREVQQALNRLGYSAGPITGTWNKRTQHAMQNFQAAHGLSPNGDLTLSSIAGMGLWNNLIGNPNGNGNRPLVAQNQQTGVPPVRGTGNGGQAFSQNGSGGGSGHH